MLREWGPCAEVDEVGHQFHYKVSAVTMTGRHYLIFQLDPGADRLQTMLQKVRERELASEQEAAAAGTAAPSMRVVRETAAELRALLRQWPGPSSTEPLLELRMALTLKADDLIKRLDAFMRHST